MGEVDEVVSRCGIVSCLAEAGDVWLYATPILHAPEAASKPMNRPVLQVDFAAEELRMAFSGLASNVRFPTLVSLAG